MQLCYGDQLETEMSQIVTLRRVKAIHLLRALPDDRGITSTKGEWEPQKV